MSVDLWDRRDLKLGAWVLVMFMVYGPCPFQSGDTLDQPALIESLGVCLPSAYLIFGIRKDTPHSSYSGHVSALSEAAGLWTTRHGSVLISLNLPKTSSKI